MAAPTPTVRAVPLGAKLKDGYQSYITFASNPNVGFWEKTVKPPGMDGGDKIKQSTMHNQSVHTYAPRTLVDITDSQTKVAYDPAVWDDIYDLLNVPTTITVHFSDGSTLAFYGFLKMFDPGEMVEGEQPEATITIVATNVDPITCVEELPVMTPAAGSC